MSYKKLSLCVAMALCAGAVCVGGVSARAAEPSGTFNSAIIGDFDRDTAYKDAGVLSDGGVYNFTQDTTIAINGLEDKAEGKRDTVKFGPWFQSVTAAISGSKPMYDDAGKTIDYDFNKPEEKLNQANSVTVNMNGHNLNIDTRYDTGTGQTGISAIGFSKDNIGKVEINDPGAISITTHGSGMTAPLFADGGGKIIIHNGGDNADQKVLTIRTGAKSTANGVGIKTMNGSTWAQSGDGLQSEITIDGLVDILADGTADADGYSANEAVSAVASDINIGGGTIRAVNGCWAAIRAYGEFVTQNYGIVNLNAVNRQYDNETIYNRYKVSKVTDFDIGNYDVKIEGDIVTNGGMGTKGQVNVGMKDGNSYWIGNYADTRGYGVTPGQFGAVNLKMKDGAYWKGFGNGSMNVQMTGAGTNWYGFSTSDKMQLSLNDGAVWYNAITPEQVNQRGQQTNAKIGYLSGQGGFVDMTGDRVFVATSSSLSGAPTRVGSSAITESTNGVTGNVDIDHYSGSTTFIYKRSADDPLAISGGTINIKQADKGSTVNLRTDAKGINFHDRKTVMTVFNNLAHKLIYTEKAADPADTPAAEETKLADNLSGQVELAEGLTTRSALLKVAKINFNQNNSGSEAGAESTGEGFVNLDDEIQTPNATVIFGDQETAMMKGAKSAMASTAMLWRATNNDIQKRLGDLRLGAADADDGIWAKVGRGRMSYDKDGADFHTTFTDYYAGYDKAVGHSNWRLGAAFSYLDGKSHYDRGGHGDQDVYSFYVYGTQMRPDNSYIDIVGRVGHLKNEYRIYNDIGNKLDGDYNTNGFALSVEYGKRFENNNGFYLEPQAEVIWSKLASKDYGAHSDYDGGNNLDVSQHSYNSFIGRIGLGLGVKKDRFSAYAKASLLHEFSGGFDTDYAAVGEAANSSHMDFGDTWVAMDLGTTIALSDRTNLFGYFERTFNGDIRTDWRYNVGLRFSF